MKNFDKIIILYKDEILLESSIQIMSKKAIAVSSNHFNGHGQDTLIWIPKSLINIIDELKNEQTQKNDVTLQSHVCHLPEWFLKKKNLL